MHREDVLQALRAGVVPRIGLQHIQVGRSKEIAEAVKDIDRVSEKGSFFRFIIGEYGSGKTHLQNSIARIACERKLVVVRADLAPDRRIQATDGQARSLYAEMMRNMATRVRPDGGALGSIVEKFVADAAQRAETEGRAVEAVLRDRLKPLEELVSGYSFTSVILKYREGFENGDDRLKSAALRWLRGEYERKTDAAVDLGVRGISIIDDSGVYEYLKVMAQFVTLAGYQGLLVLLDEMVNLFKLNSRQARNNNYEQILRIINDVTQGTASSFGIIFCGTPEFLMDRNRGLYSYDALQTRLAENSFARNGLVDFSGPVIRLQSLTAEELFVLLGKIRHVFACGNPTRHLVPDEALSLFMEHCSKRIGDSYFRTPRTSIKAFVDLLSILEQNPGTDWRPLLGSMDIQPDRPPAGIVEDLPEAPGRDGSVAPLVRPIAADGRPLVTDRAVNDGVLQPDHDDDEFGSFKLA